MKKHVPKLLLILLMLSFLGFTSFFVVPVHATTTIPSGIVYYVPVTLTNSQNSAVSSESQVSITVNWANYTSYLDNPVDNYVFFNSAGTTLYSWLESGTANTATSALLWLKLDSSGIGANSNYTVYLGFYAKGTNVLSSTGATGWAPQLSGTYGRYDNGANVFLVYFNGNSALSSFQVDPGSDDSVTSFSFVTFGSSTINAIMYTVGDNENSNDGLMYTGQNISASQNAIAESSFSSDGSGTDLGAIGLGSNDGQGVANNFISTSTQYSGAYFDQAFDDNTFSQNYVDFNQQGSTTTAWRYASITYNSADSFYSYIAPQLYSISGGYNGTVNYADQGLSNPFAGVSNLYLFFYPDVGGSGAWIQYNWARARLYPPNGVMPSSSFGSGRTAGGTISLSSSSSNVGSSVTVTGSGFAANSLLSATFGGSSVTLSGSHTTDGSGNLPSGMTFTVPASTAGEQSVVVTDASSNSGSATFTVTPSISFSPISGRVGSTVTVSGSGFAASSAITATFGGSSVTLSGTMSTDSTGSFSGATFTVPTSTAGSKSVVITDGSSNSGSYTYTVTSVIQPITVTMSNSAPSATVTITGGNPSPNTFTADGSQHSITMDQGASFTLSFSNSGNTRDGFIVSSTFLSTSPSYTASTAPISVTAYEQVSNTFSLSGVSGGDSAALTGTYLSNGSSTIVTLNSGNSWSASAWSDYDTAVTFPASTASSGSNERWSIGTAYSTAALTAGGNTYSQTYYHQYSFQLDYTVSGGGTGYSAPTLTATQFGSSYSPTLGTSLVTYWLDSGQSWSVTNPLSGSGSNERWKSRQTILGTVSSSSPNIAGTGTLTFTYYNQYYLTVTGGNSISFGTASPTGDQWYDSGTNTTVSSNWVWGTVSGQSRTAITNWQLDGANQNPNRSNTGTLITSSIIMSTYDTVNFVSTPQYYLTVTGGNSVSYGTASPTGDNWYDSGSSTSVTSNWIWNSVSGQSRTALTNWQLDGSNQNPTRHNSGTLTTSSVTMSTYHTVNLVSTTQYYLTVSGGYSVSFGTASPTGDQWYDSGGSTTVSSNGVWGRSGGSGQMVASWNLDGGSNTAFSSTGTVTTSSVSMSTYHTVNFNAVTQCQVTLDSGTTSALNRITSPTISGDNYWYDSGTLVTLTLNGIYGRSGGSGTRISGYKVNAGPNNPESTIGTFNVLNAISISALQAVTTTTVAQYQVTLDSTSTSALNSITSPTVSSDIYWYDSGTSVSVVLNGVWDRSSGVGNRLTGYVLNGGSNNPTSTVSTVTAFSGAISNHEFVTSASVTQYFLTVTGGNSISYGTASTISGDIGWYDSGSSTTVSSAWVWGTSSSTRTALTNWNLDGSSNQNPARANSGTLTTSPVTMSAVHTVNFISTAQYYLTVMGGNSVGFGTASPTGDQWFDSGSSTTVTSNWVWGTVSGQSRTAITNWQLDGSSQNPTRQGSGTLTTSSVTMSTYHTVSFSSVTQFYLTVTGGSSIGFGTASPTGYQWYDSGSSTSVSSNGVYSRSGGTGTRVTSWVLDSGSNNNVATAGTVTTSSVSMSTYHTITFNMVMQYQVALDSGATSALNTITNPTIGGDSGWYDSGTSVTLTLNGVYDRSGGSGTRVTGCKINGGSNNPEITAGSFTVLNAISISSSQTITTTTVTQYQVTLDSISTSALNLITNPTISNDNYWYDNGTSVSVVLNGVWDRSGGTGTRLTGYVLNGGSNNPTSTTSTVSVFSGPISNHQSVTATSVTQYQVTFTATGLDSDAGSNTVLTLGGAPYAWNTLPNDIWVDSRIIFTWADPLSGGSGKQFVMTDNTGASPVMTSGTFSATYKTQYQLSFSQTGLDSDTGSNTVLTVASTTYAYNALPSNVWVDNGTTFSWSSPVNGGSGKQFVLTGHAGLASPISASGTDTSTYKTQYYVTFDQSGVDSDFSGTVVTVNGTGYGMAGTAFWAYSGDVYTFIYSSPLIVTSNVKQYVLTGADTSSPLTVSGATTVTGTYKTQYYLTVSSAHGSPSGQGWYDAGATANAGLASGTVSGGGGTQYVFTGWGTDASGSAFSSSDAITMSGPMTATVGWKTQYQVTFAVSGGGSTSPTGLNVWENAGSLSITATPNGGYTFSQWSSDIGSITFSDANSASTVATINGPGTITGNFLADLDHFVFSPVCSQTAGRSFSITIAAKDAYGNTVTSYSGTPTLTYSAGSINTSSSTGGFSRGVWTGSVTVIVAGSGVTLGVDDGSGHTGISNSFTVSHAVAASSVVISPANSAVTAGESKTYSATAYDAYGNTWDATGSVTWSIDSSAGGSWSGATYTSATAGSWTVTGTYNSAPYTTGLTVTPAGLNSITISPVSPSIVAGGSQTFSAEGFDQYGNDLGSVTASYSVNGTSIIGSSVSETLVGSYTITASYGGYTVDATLTVNAGALDHFVFSSVGSQTAGSAFSITVTAVDASGNTVIDYTGTPSLSYSDGSISPSTMGAFVNGVGTTTVTVTAAGSGVTITAIAGSHTGISNSFTVNPTITASAGPKGTISPSGSVSVNYGSSQSFTITPSTGYSIASLTVDGSPVTVASSYTFSNVQAAHTISATFAVNTFTISASAGANGAISPTGSVSVNYGGSQSFTITASTGYHITDVVVDSVSQGAVSSYTFTNVQAAHAITASFAINTTTTTTIIGIESNNTIVPITLEGNITAQQMLTNVTITPNPLTTTTTLSFTITGPSGTVGFGNMTLPKTAIPYGTTPVVYIDGQQAPNQGYTQDANNFYVWYTTHFSTHQMTIQFTVPPATSLGLALVVVITVAAIVLIFIAIAIKRLRRKLDNTLARAIF